MRIPACLIAVVFASTLAASAADVTKVPAYDQFVVIPLRVHVLTSKDLDMTDGQITDAEVRKMVPRINAIWDKAGIHFGLESIVREPASQIERFKALVELNNGQLEDTDPFALLLPASSKVFDGLHLYIFHELPMNGFYIVGADAPVVKEKPELKQVAGGSDDPLSRVAARGLGQALGLYPRQDEVGLISPGTNGVGLSEVEIGRARHIAKTVTGALEVDDAMKQAEAASKGGEIGKARRLYGWLGEVPGTGSAEARKRLAALPAAKP